MNASEEELLTNSLRMLAGSGLNDAELERRVARFQGALFRLRHDQAEASRIDSLVIDVEHALQDDRATAGGTHVIGDGAGEGAPDRHRHWRLKGSWLVSAGILACVSAAVVGAATAGPSTILLMFVLGALLGVLVGGVLCAQSLRAAIAYDVGPQVQRMQIQLGNIESAVNLALASRYAELSQPWTPPVSPRSIPGQPER